MHKEYGAYTRGEILSRLSLGFDRIFNQFSVLVFRGCVSLWSMRTDSLVPSSSMRWCTCPQVLRRVSRARGQETRRRCSLNIGTLVPHRTPLTGSTHPWWEVYLIFLYFLFLYIFQFVLFIYVFLFSLCMCFHFGFEFLFLVLFLLYSYIFYF